MFIIKKKIKNHFEIIKKKGIINYLKILYNFLVLSYIKFLFNFLKNLFEWFILKNIYNFLNLDNTSIYHNRFEFLLNNKIILQKKSNVINKNLNIITKFIHNNEHNLNKYYKNNLIKSNYYLHLGDSIKYIQHHKLYVKGFLENKKKFFQKNNLNQNEIYLSGNNLLNIGFTSQIDSIIKAKKLTKASFFL